MAMPSSAELSTVRRRATPGQTRLKSMPKQSARRSENERRQLHNNFVLVRVVKKRESTKIDYAIKKTQERKFKRTPGNFSDLFRNRCQKMSAEYYS